MLFLFMCDDCNHAGIWKENFDLFKLYYGFSVGHSDMHLFGDKVARISDDTYLLQNFIKFQYGNLNPANKAHLGVIRALTYAGVDYHDYEAPLKPLGSPTGIGTGEGAGIGLGTGTGSGSPVERNTGYYTTDDLPF